MKDHGSPEVIARRRAWVKANPEYRSWFNMKTRCLNPKSGKWERYGGRGITVCDRWRDSFQAFRDDVGSQPFPGATLERIDNDGNYEPGNVRWVDRKAQARNRTSTRAVELNGERMSMAEAAERAGISQATFGARLNRGWTAAEAASRPLKGSHA